MISQFGSRFPNAAFRTTADPMLFASHYHHRAESQAALLQAQQRKMSSLGNTTVDIRMYEQLEKTRSECSAGDDLSQKNVIN